MKYLDQEGYEATLNEVLPQIIIKFILSERGFKAHLKKQKEGEKKVETEDSHENIVSHQMGYNT